MNHATMASKPETDISQSTTTSLFASRLVFDGQAIVCCVLKAARPKNNDAFNLIVSVQTPSMQASDVEGFDCEEDCLIFSLSLLYRFDDVEFVSSRNLHSLL
jgi:hypothetical protein